MERDERVPFDIESELLVGTAYMRRVVSTGEAVDHDIAHEMNALDRNAFLEEILVSIPRRREKEIRNCVSYPTVDLLRHGPVTASETGLHMSDWHIELLGGDRCRDCRIDVAENDNHIG